MARRAPPNTSATLALAGLALLASCHGIEPSVARAQRLAPSRYVVIAPQARAAIPAVRAFLARKAFQFEVATVTFDPTAPLAARIQTVRRGLATHAPDRAPAYALILATHKELPMGPWTVEGLAQPVHSDIPYFLPTGPSGQPLPRTVWTQAFVPGFAWIPGRIPFADPAILAQALWSGRHYESKRSRRRPLAMIGGERFAVWWDTSLIMSRARARIAARGWRTISYSEDWPCDIELGLTDPDSIRTAHTTALQLADDPELTLPNDILDDVPDAETMLFGTHWVRLAPDVVYINSHGSPAFIGDYLLSVPSLIAQNRWAKRKKIPFSPKRPALLINIACSGGVADSLLLKILFARRWICGAIGCTENTAPLPLGAAIRLEMQAGVAIPAGLSAGLLLRAARESYYADATSSWSYALFSATESAIGSNCFGMTFYGDPSVLLPR